ncbi:hypothetical protein [Bradyrhizobium sp. LTSP885]|uniref:hypothetical protein n=1 Tax=Bradyrhizobium sp. LTSP885 TaxID=1619232 RepID=UPI00069AC9AD|nr:hypothetical protein [Bradyrhizobium sp. LTSP885]
MPLHRDIHWLGRQWAVTGHGLQLINQKQMGYYDIAVSRLWEAGLIQSMQGKAWIDRPDFDKALELARARFFDAAPPGTPVPLEPEATAAIASAVPPVKRALEPLAVPALEELLAKLKSKTAEVAPAAKPVEAVVAAPPEAEPAKPALAESEPPEPPPPATPVVQPADPAPLVRPKPLWPAVGHKIAGKGRFVQPWRARLTRWRGDLPGLPPRS